jgi:nucleotidyltransferase/DNA polymerase involved in DNA repair
MKKFKQQKSELLQLPNVGPKTVAHMNAVGITTIAQFLRQVEARYLWCVVHEKV